MSELLVFSPHLDDAVLSCGRLLTRYSGPVVATLFTGSPSPAVSTDYDRWCGFADSDRAMQVRWREDEAALKLLKAVPVHCGLLDGQYLSAEGRQGRQDRLVATIQSLVEEHRPTILATPLGLCHKDHEDVRTAAIAVLGQSFKGRWLVYEDLPYAKHQDAVRTFGCARAHFVRSGLALVNPAEPPDPKLESTFDAKLAAIRCYGSQLPLIMSYIKRDTSDAAIQEIFEEERYHFPAKILVRYDNRISRRSSCFSVAVP